MRSLCHLARRKSPNTLRSPPLARTTGTPPSSPVAPPHARLAFDVAARNVGSLSAAALPNRSTASAKNAADDPGDSDSSDSSARVTRAAASAAADDDRPAAAAAGASTSAIAGATVDGRGPAAGSGPGSGSRFCSVSAAAAAAAAARF